VKFSVQDSSQTASGASAAVGREPPAWLTRMSRRPNCARASATMARGVRESVTSSAIARGGGPPAATTSSWSVCSKPSRRALTTVAMRA
jgi:hypothetical protein